MKRIIKRNRATGAVQLVLHGMQHHAELALMLTQKGKPPGDIDFIFYK